MNIDDIISQEAHSTLNAISQKVSEKFNISISRSTIETGLSKLRYHYKTPKHKQKLAVMQKNNRIVFANTIIEQHFHHQIYFQTIIFSDESRFVLGDDKQWFWRIYSDINRISIVEVQKFSPSIVIFGV